MIEHIGIVRAVKDKTVDVEITRISACGQCHARSTCGMTGSTTTMVQVQRMERNLSPGDMVTVLMEERMGLAAVWWGYVFPSLIFLIGFFLVLAVTNNEGLSGLIGLILLGPYYFFLWCAQNLLKNQFIFRLK